MSAGPSKPEVVKTLKCIYVFYPCYVCLSIEGALALSVHGGDFGGENGIADTGSPGGVHTHATISPGLPGSLQQLLARLKLSCDLPRRASAPAAVRAHCSQVTCTQQGAGKC